MMQVMLAQSHKVDMLCYLTDLISVFKDIESTVLQLKYQIILTNNVVSKRRCFRKEKEGIKHALFEIAFKKKGCIYS